MTFKVSVISLFISIQQVTSLGIIFMLYNTGSRLDDVDNEDGGSVCARVGLHHAVGEGGDPGKPLREGNLLLLH